MYSRYGGRGIRCLLTSAEIKSLWERDGGSKMRKPTIDRIDNDVNYEIGNCRFVPNHVNASAGRPYRRVS